MIFLLQLGQFIATQWHKMLQDPIGVNVFSGLLASFIAFGSSRLISLVAQRLRSWRFKRIFGPGGVRGFYTLVYGALTLDLAEPSHPYIKLDGDPSARFSISQPVSIAEVRAANYLANSIGKYMNATPGLRSDLDVSTTLDLDFISLGGPASNFKTQDCLLNRANRLVQVDGKTGNLTLRGRALYKSEEDFDYGVILKIHPSQFPARTWIACAGRGEWGTSGAAWFLANKWNEIRKRVGNFPFVVVVSVRPGQDESAELVEYFLG